MTTPQTLRIGYYIPREAQLFKDNNFEHYSAYFSDLKNIYGRIMLTVIDYLVFNSKKFDSFSISISRDPNTIFPNGTLSGIEGLINRSEVDIGLPPIVLNKKNEWVEFCYPYKLKSATFFTVKPRLKMQSFDISETFTMPLWITIISSVIVMMLVYYFALKRKYTFDKISLHVFAVSLRQSSVVGQSSPAEKLLFISWVIGGMFICLSFDSVVSAFLAVPHSKEITNVTQLATAVANGEYICWANKLAVYPKLLVESNVESLKIIGMNIMKNIKEYPKILSFHSIHNLAFVEETDIAEVYAVNTKGTRSFLAEDHFLEYMTGMLVRKGFCCKNLLDNFVHRLMSSGLFFKFNSDMKFLLSLPRLLKYPEMDDSKKIINLADMYPAFKILLAGYLISALVLVAEILYNHKSKLKHSKKIGARKRRRLAIKESVV